MSTRKIVMTAVLTAIITLTTIVIQIPSPMSGYVNLGDVFVLLAAFLLGPIFGTVAAGVGSMFADLLTGYVIYAPATLIIKGCMALVGAILFKSLKKCFKNKVVPVLISGVISELIMVAGYFLYAALLMGEGWVAAASIPGNLVQGAVGIAVSTALYPALIKVKFLAE